MGWAKGSELFDQIISILNNHVDEDTREAIYGELIPIFEEMDCDNLNECLNQDDAFDIAYRMIYPKLEDEDDYD